MYGTVGYVTKCPYPYSPGAFGINSNTDVQNYYVQIPSPWLLNEKYFMLPFGEVRRNPNRIFDMINHVSDRKYEFFIRPLSGRKTFTGQVFTIDNIEFEINSSMQLTSVQDETICLIAPTKKINSEFRFLIGNGRVIDGSEYRWDKKLDIRHDWDVDCQRLAMQMSKLKWQPDIVYTCDVALTDEGPRIVELNGFACAGLYAMDKDLVVESVSEIAWLEFTGALD